MALRDGHRRLIHFTAPEESWLKEEAKRFGISVSELVRRIVDEQRQRILELKKEEKGDLE